MVLRCHGCSGPWGGKTTFSAFSTTVLCMVGASVVLLATPAFAALAECQATESCGGKDDCRECVDLTANRTQCVSREFCEWGKELTIPITAADIVFVVAPILCELYTQSRSFRHAEDYVYLVKEDGTAGFDHICSLLSFLVYVGFTVGKLFPTSYWCRSLDCAKLAHNCVMTLAGFLFSALECKDLNFWMAELHEESEAQPIRGTVMVKLLEVLCMAYIIYDVATTVAEPPGVGTTVLVVFSCLAEVLLICFGGYTVFKYEMPSIPSTSELRIRGDRTGENGADDNDVFGDGVGDESGAQDHDGSGDGGDRRAEVGQGTSSAV